MSSAPQPSDRHSNAKEEQEKEKCRTFGDSIEKKHKDSVRIMFQNVNGFGYTRKSVKSLGIRDLINNKRVDVMAMAELNKNWGRMRRANTLAQVCKGWFRSSRAVVSYNQHERRRKKSKIHQPGGTAVVLKGEMALRAGKSSYDSLKMGRWASIVIQGKAGIRTRIVSVYVPILASEHGHKKVATQQQRALLTMGIKDNVINRFWEDFWKQIDIWRSKGEQLIIGGDWNTDVTKEKFLKQFKQRELFPAMSTKHGNVLPETHNNGSKAIDEIFISSSLNIVAAGYLEHGSNLADHRPIWVDLEKSTVIGLKTTLAPTYQARRLKTNDPRVVEKYVERMIEILEEHHFEVRCERLFQSTQYPLTPWQQAEYEELDAIRIKAAETAEKECRKLKMGYVEWCPKIQQARDRIRYYLLSKRKLLGRKVSSSILYRLAKKTGCNAVGMTEEEMKDQVDNAFKYYKTLKKQSAKLREDFIEGLAKALEKKGKGKKAKIIAGLIATEGKREMFRKLKSINKKDMDLSTKFVTVNRPEGKVIITDKVEMEKAIIEENRHKYHQTEGTCPFMHPPLRQQFGEAGTGPATESVLNGTYNPPKNVTEHTREYLEMCRMPERELVVNPLTRSLDYFSQSWKKSRERTSSRGLHFGHYRAATEYPTLMKYHYQMAEIPFRSGYSPKRWKKANNVMILKKEGVSDLDRLRTIVLFESDFNHNNKFLGRQMMHHMADQGMIAEEQYSRPGRKCIDHVLNRRLYFDMVRYQKSSAAMAAVDLKSCYDRVAHAPAYLAMRSYGIPAAPVECMFETLQDMQYYTITHHGISDRSFGGQEKGYIAKPNGFGQGNGSGPSGWSVTSSKMFQVMHHRGSATTITSPITGYKTDICGFAYVDDTDLISMLKKENNVQGITKRMQNVVNDWEAVAKTTGGALVPKKCWCWIINFGWKAGTWYYEDTTKMGLKMSIKDEEDKWKNMTLLPPSEAREMLGVRLAPDGNNKAQIEAIKEKMKRLAENIRVGHVNRHEAWVALSTIAMKSLEYMLPAMTITEEEYREIMAPVLAQFLPKMGINRNIKRDLLYSTSTVQGFNLKNPYVTQGVEHVKDISENLWKDSLTGKLLQCNLEQLRLEIGENIDILSSDYYTYEPGLLTQSYVRNTWQFMTDNGIQLDDKTAKITQLRSNDVNIMTAFRNNSRISENNMKVLNRCRMYLKVFTLSDIATSCGRFIRYEAWHGRQFNTGREDLNWPIWGRPGLRDWTYWRTALKLTFGDIKERSVKEPLGEWTTIPSKWEFFAQQVGDRFILWRKHKKKWKRFARRGRSRIVHRFSTTPMKRKKPPPCYERFPVSVRILHGCYIMDDPVSVNLGMKMEESKQLKTKWLNVDKYKKGSEYKLSQALITGEAMAVSDGSYSDNSGKGTASWMITTKDKMDYVTAGALSPGPSRIQSAYRSEVLGILGVLEELYNICQRRNILQGQCTIFCDGLSALQVVERLNRDNLHSRYTACDLLSACVKLKEKIPLKLHFSHVKGHQDDEVEIHLLSLPSQLNVLMDGLAKDLLTVFDSKLSHLEVPFHEYAMPLPRCGDTVHQQFKVDLYELVMNKKGHKYWIEKERYKQEDIDIIDWEVQRNAFSSEKSTRQRTLAKWISGWLGTGKNMRRWNLRYCGNCPFCQTPDETTNHVIRCTHQTPTSEWKRLLKEFDATLIKIRTSYDLRKAIIMDLRSWRSNSRLPSLQYITPELQLAITEQRQIGWSTFLEGLVSIRIIEYQKDFLTRKHPQLKQSNWAKKVIKAGWKMLMGMWEHRNENLHKPDTIQNMEGQKILNRAVRAEWKVGIGDLPTFEFTQFFRIKIKKLMKKSLEGKKDWLANVKMARVLYKDKNKLTDEFDTDVALREWIGLPKIREQNSTEEENFLRILQSLEY